MKSLMERITDWQEDDGDSLERAIKGNELLEDIIPAYVAAVEALEQAAGQSAIYQDAIKKLEKMVAGAIYDGNVGHHDY